MIENENKTNENAVTENRQENAGRPASRDGQSRGGRRPARSGNPRSKRKFFMKKKACFFCKNKEAVIDYKDVNLMRRFIAESGKIVPRRFSGTCAKHQRKLSTEIKKARQMALIPYTDR